MPNERAALVVQSNAYGMRWPEAKSFVWMDADDYAAKFPWLAEVTETAGPDAGVIKPTVVVPFEVNQNLAEISKMMEGIWTDLLTIIKEWNEFWWQSFTFTSGLIAWGQLDSWLGRINANLQAQIRTNELIKRTGAQPLSKEQKRILDDLVTSRDQASLLREEVRLIMVDHDREIPEGLVVRAGQEIESVRGTSQLLKNLFGAIPAPKITVPATVIGVMGLLFLYLWKK